jgi:hypothetical protein
LQTAVIDASKSVTHLCPINVTEIPASLNVCGCSISLCVMYGKCIPMYISKSSRRPDHFLLLFTTFDALIESNCLAYVLSTA